MEPKIPNLSAYDFLGYLLPGVCFLALCDLSIFYHDTPASFNHLAVYQRYSSVTWQGLPAIVLVGYFVGHLVSFVSALTIERHALWVYDQPSRFLVQEKRLNYLNAEDDTGSPSSRISIVLRCFVFAFMMPVSVVERASHLCGFTWKYHRPMPKLIVDALKGALNDLSKRIYPDAENPMLPPGKWGNGFESLALHCALETAPAHLLTLRNYVVLYGFLRSMTLILLLVFWVTFIHQLLAHQFLLACVTLVAAVVVSTVSYAAFIKFWFRYHKETLFAFIASFAMRAQPSP